MYVEGANPSGIGSRLLMFILRTLVQPSPWSFSITQSSSFSSILMLPSLVTVTKKRELYNWQIHPNLCHRWRLIWSWTTYLRMDTMPCTSPRWAVVPNRRILHRLLLLPRDVDPPTLWFRCQGYHCSEDCEKTSQCLIRDYLTSCNFGETKKRHGN